jgi:hypothetical protein
MKSPAYLAYPAQIVAVFAATLAWMVVVAILDLLTEEEPESELFDLAQHAGAGVEAPIVDLVEEREPEAA